MTGSILRCSALMLSGGTLAFVFGAGGNDGHIDQQPVLIPVTVLDRKGAPVNGLSVTDFTLSESGVEQTITGFNRNAPLSIVILLDTSASRRYQLEDGIKIVVDVLSSMSAEDEFCVVGVNNITPNVARFTSDAQSTVPIIKAMKPGGPTARRHLLCGRATQCRTTKPSKSDFDRFPMATTIQAVEA